MKASYADHALTRPVALRRNSVGRLAAGPPIVASPMGPSSFRYKFGCMKHEGHEEHEAVTKSSIKILESLNKSPKRFFVLLRALRALRVSLTHAIDTHRVTRSPAGSSSRPSWRRASPPRPSAAPPRRSCRG